MPAIDWLSMKEPWPSMSGASSFRRMGRPTYISVVAMGSPSGVRAAHPTGGVQDRLDDVLVSGAPAEVPLEGLADLRLGWRRVLLKEAGGRHQHARCAVPALEAVVAMERVLERVQGPVRPGQSLDRRDLSTVRLDGEERAGLHGLAVEVDRARAAGRRVTPDVGSGESQLLSEEVDEERARLDIGLAPRPIDGDGDLRHEVLLPDGARCRVGRDPSTEVENVRVASEGVRELGAADYQAG